MYCMRGLTRTPPQPHASSTRRRGRRRAAASETNSTGTASSSAMTERAIGSSCAPTPDKLEPGPADPAHATDTSGPGHGLRGQARDQAEGEYGGRRDQHRRPHGPRTALVGRGRPVRPGARQERDAVGLDEGEQRQSGGQGHHRDRHRHRDRDQAVLGSGAVDQGLQQRPLGHEPRGHGQRGRAEGPDPERQGGDRHPGAEPAHPVQVALTGAMQHRAGGEEQRALERGMAGDQQQTGRDRGVGRPADPDRPEQQRRSRAPGTSVRRSPSSSRRAAA